MIRILLFLLLLCGVSACDSSHEELVLQQADREMAKDPGNAMLLLQQLEPASLSRPHMAHYALLQAQRLIESPNPIYCDSLLNQAIAYYADHDDEPHLRARTYFYAGHAKREERQFVEAMALFVEADKSVRRCNDHLLRGRILAAMGRLYRKQYHLRSSIECFEEAMTCFEQENHTHFMLRGAMGLAVDYEQLGDTVMADSYWKRAQELADLQQDTVAQLYIARAVATDLVKNKKYRAAIDIFYEATDRWAGGVVPSDYYFGLSLAYLRLHQYDSASLYLHSRITDLEDQQRREALYDQSLDHWNIHNRWLAGEYYSLVGNFEKAYKNKSWALRRADSLYRAEKASPIPSIRGRSMRMHLQERNRNLAEIVLLQWLLAIVLLVAALFLTLWLIARRQQVILTQKQTIARYRDAVKALQESYRQEQLKPRSGVDQGVIDRRVDFLRRFLDTILLYGHKEGVLNQKMSALISSESDQGLSWMIEDILNMREPGIVGYLRETYPQLSERELCIYGMICLDMDKSAICLAQRISVKTYYNVRNILRGKLQLTNNSISFADHFATLCETFRRAKNEGQTAQGN